jgi:hypothetical protein
MILQDEILGRFARQEQLKEDGTTPFPLSAVPTGLLLFPFAYPGFHPVLFPVRAVQIGEAVDFLALVLLDRLRLRPGLQNQVAMLDGNFAAASSP